MNRASLLSFGNKTQFLQLVAQSPALKSLWATKTLSSVEKSDTSINCIESLPLVIRSKNQITQDVSAAGNRSALGIKLRLGMTYARELARFYKHGVMAVWTNQRHLRLLKRKKYKLSGVLDRTGTEVDIAIPTFKDLTKSMAQQVYIRSMEDGAVEGAKKDELVRWDASPKVSPRLFSMTRAEYQLLKRTPADFAKIPLFAVIATVFMELTPLVCYVFPELTPLTCILPSILPRIWRPKTRDALRNAVEKEIADSSVEDFAMKTAFNLPPKTLRALALCLRLKSKYIPTTIFPESILRNRLQSHFLYLLVDNYYLSGLNGGGNLWDLTTQELVLACLERNLIDNTRELVKIMNSATTHDKQVFLDSLRLKLLLFIANFKASNVGYLAVDHMLPEPESSVMMEWRKP